jgi:hypothetical protein
MSIIAFYIISYSVCVGVGFILGWLEARQRKLRVRYISQDACFCPACGEIVPPGDKLQDVGGNLVYRCKRCGYNGVLVTLTPSSECGMSNEAVAPAQFQRGSEAAEANDKGKLP